MPDRKKTQGISMDKLGIKATIYDLLGYIIPGIFMLAGWHLCHFPISTPIKADLLQGNISITFAVIIGAIGYFVGHLLASIGSLVFENRSTSKYILKVYKIDYSIFDARSVELFSKRYQEIDPRLPVVFCQKNHPECYETAFVFLAIYGFSRNCLVALILLFPVAIYCNSYTLFGIFLHFIVIAFTAHNYFRFRKYFQAQIASSLLIKQH